MSKQAVAEKWMSADETSIAPVVSPQTLTNDVSRAEAINGILVDAGNKPERYLEAFEIKGGGE